MFATSPIYPRPTAILGLTAIVGASILAGCGSTSSTAPTTKSNPTTSVPSTRATSATSLPAEAIALKIETGKMDGKPGWPRFVPSDINVRSGAKVTFTITNYDDGAAPLPSSLASYEKITGGTETVDGTAVAAIPNADISHTLSVPNLGVNVVIPVVPKNKQFVTVAFTFTPTKTGTFTWHCFAPCGSGSDGMTGAMSTMDWMEGNLTVS